MPHVADLRIYPVKSLSPCRLETVHVSTTGALANDRRWAFVDDEGKFWNGKRTPAVHGFTCNLLPADEGIRLTHRDGTAILWPAEGNSDAGELERWFSERIGGPARWVENRDSGFPDDPDSPGPTLISTASIELIASWFPGLTPESVRQRLRANIEIDGVPAFWEDRLCRGDGQPQPFRIGPVAFLGINPCQRCVVPSRDPGTGEVIPLFQKLFCEHRRGSLPEWAPAERFDHYYRATVNTRLQPCDPGPPLVLHVGDEVEIL